MNKSDALFFRTAVHCGTALLLSFALSACGTDAETSGSTTGADAGTDAPAAEDQTLFPNAPPLPGETECKAVIDTNIPVGPAMHVPNCTDVTYSTNPPSGGNHWGIWANFKEYETAIPREVYVHDMEHGAVILAYRCASSCPEVVDLLRSVASKSNSDTLCLQYPGGPERRIIITPDPELDTPIAAAAWGATYTATCIDEASLLSFVASHYAKGPENTCYPGIDFADPNAGVPTCNTPAP